MGGKTWTKAPFCGIFSKIAVFSPHFAVFSPLVLPLAPKAGGRRPGKIVKRKAKPVMQHPSSPPPVLSAPSEQTLGGLSPQCWAAYALLGSPLVATEPKKEAKIPPTLLYPTAMDAPPTRVRIITKDFGKRGLKGASVDNDSLFVTSTIPDAYRSLTGTFQQEESEEGEEASYSYKVRESGRETETFLMGTPALRRADLLPTDEDTEVRLSDMRTRHMLQASVAFDLHQAGAYHNQTQAVLLCLGVPVRDLDREREAATRAAAAQLKGTWRVEQTDLRTNLTLTWTIEVIGVLVEQQSKGTLYAATRKLGGESALSKKIFQIFDIGGGDTNELEVDASGAILAQGRRRGDGTISVARELVRLVEDAYGLALSEIEAQEALYTHTIWRGGEEENIAPLIEQLRPRFSELLTRINITRQALSAFIIFTSGGAALMANEIRAMMGAKSKNLLEGKDYLIIPATLSAVANVIGLYALAYYKAQQQIKRAVTDYGELSERLEQAQHDYEETERLEESPTQQKKLLGLEKTLATLSEQRKLHVANAYPRLVKQQILQRRAVGSR
jgi:hypothetical protein